MTDTPVRLRHIGVGTFTSTQRMRDYVATVFDSGQISYGAFSLEFEQRFAKWHECAYGILSNSGTSSLQVALQAMKEIHHWPDGGRVVLPITTFVATANIILQCRMVPTFVDVDPITYSLDPTLIERALTDNTRCIIPVSLFGQPADLSTIAEIAKRYRLKVLVDSCETMFARHWGRSCGAWGDITAFSMYVAHLLVTGVGGISTTDNPDYAAKMRSLVNHGLTIDALNPGANFSPQPMPGRRFRFDSHGYSYRITEFEAALGVAQLDQTYIEDLLAIRQRNAKHLTQGLTNINSGYGDTYQVPLVAEGNTSAWMMYPIVIRRGDKEDLIRHLLSYGIECRDMLPILGQPATGFKYLAMADYPVSANIVKNGIYVGIHQNLTPADIRYMVDVFGMWADKEYPGILSE